MGSQTWYASIHVIRISKCPREYNLTFNFVTAVDVTHWDGLTDIENASDLPFYHIVPDQKDCIEAFGAERPFRYVCEANLEECPAERSFIDVDISAEKWSRRPTEAKYDVPYDARFKYAEDSEEDNVTAECLTAIMVRGRAESVVLH